MEPDILVFSAPGRGPLSQPGLKAQTSG